MEIVSPCLPVSPLTIGIRGSGPGAGKSTVGEIICEDLQRRALSHRREAFAAALRECIQILTGVPTSESETSAGKSRELPGWKMTVGELHQRLGTETVRNVHPEAWIFSLFRRLDTASVVVITDVRFPNEAEAIRKRRGVIIHVVRGEGHASRYLGGRDPAHLSERAFTADDPADLVIRNEGTLKDLRENVLRAVGRLYDHAG